MTRDDVEHWTREAGGFSATPEFLERFATLVAAAEREACAAIAETPVTGEQDDITMEAKDRVAAAIRARGDKPCK